MPKMKFLLLLTILLNCYELLQLTEAQSVSVCSKTAEVINSRGYEKSVCFIRGKLNVSAARAYCAKYKMRLYDKDSSPAAARQLLNFIATLKVNLNLPILIENLRSAQCQAVTSGKFNFLACSTAANFICEFQNQANNLLPGPGDCGLNVDSRIFGGSKTLLQEFPWMALLQFTASNNRSDFLCGGTLINPRYVLTASHCVNGNDLPNGWSLTSVRLGEWDLSTSVDCIGDYCNDPPVDIPIELKIPHPSYNPSSLSEDNDIALLRLSRDVDFSEFIQPICLPIDQSLRNIDYTGQNFTVVGWGYTELGSRSNTKLKVTVAGVSNSNCQKVYGSEITDMKLCAGGVKGMDSCSGDSGGPLMTQNLQSIPPAWYAAGVVSYGIDCGLQGVPGVYTRVDKYMQWIQATIQP